MKKVLLLLLSISFVLSLISCTNSPETLPTGEKNGTVDTAEKAFKTEAYEPIPVPEFITSSKDFVMFENYVFSNDKPIIKYQKFDSIKTGGTELSYDELYNTSDQRSLSICYLADVEETNKAGGVPVLLMAYRYFGKDSSDREAEFSAIQLFNTGTKETQVIISDITEYISSMCLYKDTVFYTTEEGSVCKVNKDGTGNAKIKSAYTRPYIISVYEGNVYYGSGTKNIRRCGIDLANDEEMPETNGAESFAVHGGYLYYVKNSGTVKTDSGEYSNRTIYRRKFSDLKNTEEKLFEGIYEMYLSGDRLFYYTLEDMSKDTDEKNSTLRAYDLLQDQDLGVIFVNEAADVKRYCIAFYGNYGFGFDSTKSIVDDKYYEEEDINFILDINTGKVKTMNW